MNKRGGQGSVFICGLHFPVVSTSPVHPHLLAEWRQVPSQGTFLAKAVSCSGVGGGSTDAHARRGIHTAVGPRQCRDSRGHLCVCVCLQYPYLRGVMYQTGVQQTWDAGVASKQVAISDSVCSCGCHWRGVLWDKISLE